MSGCGSTAKDDPNSQAALDKLYGRRQGRPELRQLRPRDQDAGEASKAAPPARRWASRPRWTWPGPTTSTAERAQAVSTLDRFIKLNPSSPAMDYALYMKGIVNFNEDLGLFGRLAGQDVSERDQQASREALLAFRQLVEQFPESKYAADATDARQLHLEHAGGLRECTWRATTSTARPTWPRPTARAVGRGRVPVRARPSRKRSTS